MNQVYRPPPQRVKAAGLERSQPKVRAYRPPKSSSKTAQRVANAQWVGASILIFSIAPNGNVYFLLGREAEHEGYRDSGKWSDFGGGAKSHEDEFTCAAREFLEETQRTINPFPEKYGHSLPDLFVITQELKDDNYTARIDFNFLNTKFPRTYTTFLIEIPWDPTLVARFTKRARATAKPFTLVNRYSNFQGKLNSKKNGEFEKTAIEFFSIPCLLGEARYRGTPRDSVPQFRPFFMRRMRKILKLAFPKNMAQYRTLDEPTACRELYQGPGIRVPIANMSKKSNHPNQRWTRGVQMPRIHYSKCPTDIQPPSRIFQNFNTHRKYPAARVREAVDKIYY